MRWIRCFMLMAVMVLGMTFSLQIVSASDVGHGPNTGDYVYQDKEYVTNGQYDRLEQINNEIDRDAHPQKLYVVIVHSGRFSDVSEVDPWSVKENVENVIADGDMDEFMFGKEDSDAEDFDENTDQNNYLVYDTKNHQLTFSPSEDASDYITDFKFWRYRLGLKSDLNSDNENTQIAAVFKMADKLAPNYKKIAHSEHHLKAMDYNSVTNKLGIGILIAAVLIVGMFIIYFGNDSHTNAPMPGNSEYDAGFDEGAYYGSHNEF